jgi:hypothetical protein
VAPGTNLQLNKQRKLYLIVLCFSFQWSSRCKRSIFCRNVYTDWKTSTDWN